MIARNVFNMCLIWKEIEDLSSTIQAKHQTEVIISCVRLLRRTTRWFLRCKRMHLDMEKTIHRYAASIKTLKKSLPASLGDAGQEVYLKKAEHYRSLGLPEAMAYEITSNQMLFFAMDIIEISHEQNIAVDHVGKMYFKIGEFLDLTWVRKHLIEHSAENQWEALSREALRDDLDWQQRELTAAILQLESNKKANVHSLEAWSLLHESLIARWHQVIAELRSSSVLNYTMFFVAIRELVDLTQTTVQRSSENTVCSLGD